ncbi:MAG TPA: right-handed parallel beta-helix repeat-containing protein, partial [Polyangiaceae bacterium]
MRFTRFHVSGVLLAFFAPLAAHAATTYYVAPTGSDAANGTATGTPFATWGHAQSVAKPGDTVYFRAGKYTFTKGTTTCGNTASTIDGITLNVSGTAGNTINYFAYPGEVPVIDFSGIKDQCRVKGIDVTGSYIYLKGLEIMGTPQCPNPCQNHESWGIYVSNSHNTFELLNLHDNMGPGIYINSGGNNLVLNCDSHDNYDPYSWDRTNNVVTPGQNADGFGCHIGAGNTGNVFRGCRAWRNTDDGWDFIQAQEVCTVENSWAWNMGQAMYQGAIVKPSAGNGNGFKGGGYGEPPTNVPANPPSHVIQHCLSVGNKAAGFYANHEPAADHWYNNTSYGNNPGFNLLGDPANVGILRNNLALSGTLLSNNTGNGIDESFNSWDTNLGVTVSTADFQGMNVSVTGLDAARQADGSLPEVTNFHLVAGSDLIDKGTDVGLPFTGKAPDLGAFEYGATTSGAGGAGGAAGAGAGGAAGAGAG